MLSPWQRFREEWEDGCGSVLCPLAGSICLARGAIPCSVIFVGEGPGASENSQGLPFIGPAGHLLDRIIINSGLQDSGIRYALTNLVGCMPQDPDGVKTGAPEHADIMKCRPRLEEFIQLCNPQLIVAVGKLAEQYLNPKHQPHIRISPAIKQVAITHPSAILQMPLAQQGLAEKRCTVVLTNVLEEMFQ